MHTIDSLEVGIGVMAGIWIVFAIVVTGEGIRGIGGTGRLPAGTGVEWVISSSVNEATECVGLYIFDGIKIKAEV